MRKADGCDQGHNVVSASTDVLTLMSSEIQEGLHFVFRQVHPAGNIGRCVMRMWMFGSHLHWRHGLRSIRRAWALTKRCFFRPSCRLCVPALCVPALCVPDCLVDAGPGIYTLALGLPTEQRAQHAIEDAVDVLFRLHGKYRKLSIDTRYPRPQPVVVDFEPEAGLPIQLHFTMEAVTKAFQFGRQLVEPAEDLFGQFGQLWIFETLWR